jgi:3-oxoacyl-[acyl-carrier-protein] synthase II
MLHETHVRDRAGFVMSEGCGVVVLETEEHALARGAKIYCELAGYGSSCDAHHITAPAPDGNGLRRCMEMALKDGNVAPTVRIELSTAHCTAR